LKTLVYANHPDKAREILGWVTALSTHVPMDVTIQTVDGAGPLDRAAAKILAEGLAPGGGSRMVEVKARGGSPEEAIAAQVLECDYNLVALAPAGRKGFIRLFYGSMVAHVVRRLSTSVLVVRGEGTAPPRKILVCVSGSRHSLTNVTVAAQIAGWFGSDLSLLTILSQVSVDMAGTEPFEGASDSFLANDHPLAAHLRVAAEIGRKIGSPPKVRVRQGLISDEIVDDIRENGHDLLVIGTHRAEDFDTVYEDITNELVQASPVSTLVVGMRAELL